MIPRTIRKSHILQAIQYIDTHGFPAQHTSTGYDLVYNNKRFPPKYVISLAYVYVNGEIWDVSNFSGGEETNSFLTKNEFVIISKYEPTSQESKVTDRDWTYKEVRNTVNIYMTMLKLELKGQVYNKSAYRRDLLPRLKNRTHGAVEFKNENISAILNKHYYPYIDGYKPRANYQAALEDVIISYLDYDEELANILTEVAEAPFDIEPEITNTHGVVVEPPVKQPDLTNLQKTNRRIARPGTNFASREGANRLLGDKGEKYVLDFEIIRLTEANLPHLAAQVEWVSNTKGDGLGYDIASFNNDGSHLHIEVKTTRMSINMPFIITENEVRASHQLSDSYVIYRVFNFSSYTPNIYMLRGPVDTTCELLPLNYIARAGK